MKIKEIRNKTAEEIVNEVKNLKEELFRLRFRKVTDEIEDSSLIGKIRKDIARLKTVLHGKEIKTSTQNKTTPEATSGQPVDKKDK